MFEPSSVALMYKSLIYWNDNKYDKEYIIVFLLVGDKLCSAVKLSAY